MFGLTAPDGKLPETGINTWLVKSEEFGGRLQVFEEIHLCQPAVGCMECLEVILSIRYSILAPLYGSGRLKSGFIFFAV